ncbi:MAG: hypothetical protein KGN01_07035 [Patescibacteria group bacterium]|nr:hypothetical protein [Patescibacteria group bacterium]
MTLLTYLTMAADFLGPGSIQIAQYQPKRKKRKAKKKKIRGATVHRYVNRPPADMKEQFEVHDRKGKTIARSWDQAGAENRKNELDRKKFKLKGYPALQYAKDFKNGRITVNDNRLRWTTGGTGGTGGGGQSNG